MSIELIMFLVLAAIAVVTALGMLLSSNAVYSALYLVLNFVTVAIFYLLLSAPLIAMVQITVYAGAIMVLFLFVIMLLGAERIHSEFERKKLILPSVLALLLAAEATFLLFGRVDRKAAVFPPMDSANTLEALREVGLMLFNKYLLPFEMISVLLLVAMIGAIVLIKKEKGQ